MIVGIIVYFKSKKMAVYKIIKPVKKTSPIILSIPHAGITFPEDIQSKLISEIAKQPEDTDWFVDTLYDFAPSLGITTIIANYSRWVIDLNRNPQNQPLYNDGRVITDIITLTDFNGNSIYKENYIPDTNEIGRRKKLYYDPYHQKIEELLQETKTEFGKALLFDAHSIKKLVPGIHEEPFPDLILGDNNETSAHPELIKTATSSLENKGYEFSHNYPFKGGYITRNFGRPEQNIHALQLEMAKTNYMDDSETFYHKAKANKIRAVLKETLINLKESLEKL